MDNMFYSIIEGAQFPLNMASTKENFLNLEIRIRVINEIVRVIHHSLPFKTIPFILVVECVKFCVWWLNVFPSKVGLANISPRTLIICKYIDCNLHC